VVNSAFRHLREDLTRRSPTVKSSQQPDDVTVNDVVSITRHVTPTSSASNVKPSKLPQRGISKLPTKSHEADSSVVKAHSGKYFCRLITTTREFPTPPSGGLIPPNFRTTPPASGGKEGERGRGGRGKGKGRGEGKGPLRVG